ncbi:hypothetical protein ABZY20_32415 [Streptomyces sp. NPDC006624]|uniref:hypothetical protein n=1 Tax=Streptomyces sp. NPDC006624 TaxID=3154892 RepID=UPI0033BF2E55
MSGNSYHFGDSVSMHGGSGNTGIVKNGGSGETDPALRLALAELLEGVRELREQLPAPSAQLIDDSLPVLAADAAPAQERHRALMAVAAIAAAVGAVGQPVAEAANRVLQMLGGQ